VGVAAHVFAASMLARHERARVARIAPPPRIWRRLPAPIALRPEVHVVTPVTHLLRTMTHTTGALAARPRADAPMLPRLEARAERTGSVMVARRPGGESPTAGSRAAARPVARVLARPVAMAGAVMESRAAPVVPARPTPRWAASGDRRADDAQHGLDRVDVARLTDRVVDALDRRLLGLHERIRR
jgi:hypothetical protein